MHKIHYSLENFCSASGRGLHVLYTASDSRGKLSRLAENPRDSELVVVFLPAETLHSKTLDTAIHTYGTCMYITHAVCMISTVQYGIAIPYNEKLLSGKTFAVVHKIHYSLENFRGASGRDHHVLYTASDSRGKLLRLAKKPRKFSPRKFCRIWY